MAWVTAQNNNEACKMAKHHLMTDKMPTQKAEDLHNEMIFLIRTTSIAADSLLVTQGDSITYKPGNPKEEIVVPHNVAPGLLYHLHNNQSFAKNPSKSQLILIFNRRFYT